MAKILLLNGPNLNLLGQREPGLYGADSLGGVIDSLRRHAHDMGHELADFQHNGEGELVSRIHRALTEGIDAIIFNPGAYTHTSIALRDALLGVEIPFIEVHISNIYAREPFRQRSWLSDIARGVISGLGIRGYHLALIAIDDWLNPRGQWDGHSQD
ncbi:MAG: type II 3-dehydroquinate dehydratase [Pseudomonadota bacterium]|nr:type II 3-dehydroquinate dehydratase [Pseudomonadota bacterium]